MSSASKDAFLDAAVYRVASNDAFVEAALYIERAASTNAPGICSKLPLSSSGHLFKEEGRGGLGLPPKIYKSRGGFD